MQARAPNARLLMLLVLPASLVCAGPAVAALLYVSNQGDASVSVIDTANEHILATLKTIPGPAMIAATPDGARIYITHPEQGKISMLDGLSVKPLTVIDVPETPFGIAFAEGRVFVSDWNKNIVTVLDGKSGEKVASLTVGHAPAQIVYSPLNRRIFVANREGNSVTVIDADRLMVIATIAVGKAPFALAISPSGDRLYVANVQSSDLSVIGTESLEELATIKVGAMPYGLAVSPDGDRVLVANQQSGTVDVVDAKTLEIIHHARVGRYPENIVMHPDGSKAYVVNWMSGDISMLDGMTGKELKRLEAGEGARGLAIITSR